MQTIGKWGISILYLFFFLLLWTLADFRLVRLDTDPALLWCFLVVTAFVFAVGVTWVDLRKIRFRLRNQFKPKQELGDEWDF